MKTSLKTSNKSKRSIVLSFAIAGVLVPVAILLIGFIELWIDIKRIPLTTIYGFFLWPSRIMLLGIHENLSIGGLMVLCISIGVNVVLYTMIGLLVKGIEIWWRRLYPASTMVHILLIAIGLLASSQVFAQDHSCGSHAMTTTTKADGSKVGLFISPTQISSSPAWKPGTGEPPLSLSKAIQLALRWAQNEYKRFDDVQVRSINVTTYGCPDPKDRWYYNVDFTPIMDGNPMFATGYFVAVLMDGTIIAPTQIK